MERLKVPRKYLEALVEKGLVPPSVLEAAEAAGAVTAGTGTGVSAVTRLIETGMPEETARTLEKARVAYNAAQKTNGSRWRLRFVVQEMGGSSKED